MAGDCEDLAMTIDLNAIAGELRTKLYKFLAESPESVLVEVLTQTSSHDEYEREAADDLMLHALTAMLIIEARQVLKDRATGFSS